MAFDETKMNRLNVGSDVLFIYRSTDDIATVVASGYFDDFSSQLKLGAVIIVVDSDAVTVDLIVVDSAAEGATPVTTVNGT